MYLSSELLGEVVGANQSTTTSSAQTTQASCPEGSEITGPGGGVELVAVGRADPQRSSDVVLEAGAS